VCLDGHFWENITANTVTVEALDTTSEISIVSSRSGCGPVLPPKPPVLRPSMLTGTWTGAYTCLQGLTGLRLVIRKGGPGHLKILFEFYPVPSNSNVPSGSFAMRGSYSGTGIVFRQDYWISQPSGYEMVDLVGPLPINGDMHGSVESVGNYCTTYSVRRVAR
jgi:hypothetical protein